MCLNIGCAGKCKVEDTPKGWYITLIQRDPNEELTEEKRNKRMAAEKAEEERHLSALAEQVGKVDWDKYATEQFC